MESASSLYPVSEGCGVGVGVKFGSVVLPPLEGLGVGPLCGGGVGIQYVGLGVGRGWGL